jgi:hypothetical protein
MADYWWMDSSKGLSGARFEGLGDVRCDVELLHAHYHLRGRNMRIIAPSIHRDLLCMSCNDDARCHPQMSDEANRLVILLLLSMNDLL